MSYNLKNIKQEFKQKGIFYTPKELAELLKSYVPFKPKSIYDPTCGDGGLLSVFEDDVLKFGQEINSDQLEIAKERLTNFTGYCGDTLKEPAFTGMKFDCIMANPPFSIKWEPFTDERFCNVPVLPPQSKADYAFLIHILHYLSDDGIAVTLNFPGILYRGNKEGVIRKWLIENNYIERVVDIPPKTFVDTPISTALIIFKKNKKTTDIIFESRRMQKERVVSFNEIVANNFTLSVSNYIEEENKKVEIDIEKTEFETRDIFIKNLRKELNFSKMVCEFENMDFNIFLNSIYKVLDEYKNK